MRSSRVAVLALLFTCVLSAQQSVVPAPAQYEIKNPFNPAPFQGHAASPSSTVRFWFSPEGLRLAKRSGHPNVRSMLQHFGVDLGPPLARTFATPRAAAPGPKQPTQRVSTACNSSTGTKFNLEPLAGMPDIGIPAAQNEETVDFIPKAGRGGNDLVISGANDVRGLLQINASNDGVGTPNPFSWGLSNTGYYVARDGGCGPSFEGGLPHIHDFDNGDDLFGLGDPVISADVTHGNVYAADLRDSRSVTAVGLFRTNAGLLTDENACPSGTHVGDEFGNDVTASSCWPVGILVGSSSPFLSMVDKPHIRADERRNGPGAGDVYVSWTQFGFRGRFSFIDLSVCKGDFTSVADCSDPITISGDDGGTQFSHMVVRPDGILSITYVNTESFFDPFTAFLTQIATVRYVTCQPQSAPNPPICSDPTVVATEVQPIFSHLASNAFRVATYPVHDVRVRNGQVEEVIAWTRCRQNTFVPIGIGFDEVFSCPRAEVVYTSSLTDPSGAAFGWSMPTPIKSSGGDQFFPWVAGDRSTGNVAVQYYSSENDVFHHRLQLMVSRLLPDGREISPPSLLLSAENEPDPDVIAGPTFYGDYIGLASRLGRSYSVSTFSNFSNYGGGLVLGQDNVLTGFADHHREIEEDAP